jgi:hypothetical protein
VRDRFDGTNRSTTWVRGGAAMAERDRKDPDGPRFVPEIFEQEHLAEARRKVAASHRRSSRSWGRLMPVRRTVGPRQRLRVLLLLGHGAVGLLVVLFAAITDTWMIGSAMFLVVAVSFGISWYVAGIFRGSGADPGPDRGRSDRASR